VGRLVVLSAWRFVLVGWLVIGKEDKNHTHIKIEVFFIDQWIDILVIDICFKDWFLVMFGGNTYK